MPSVKTKNTKKPSARKKTKQKKVAGTTAEKKILTANNTPAENNNPIENTNTDNNRSTARNFNYPEETHYVNINEHHPDLQKKYQIMWIIIGVATLILMAIWFWSLKVGVSNSTKGLTSKNIQQEIQDSIDKIRNDFEQAQQPLQSEADVTNVKNDIINQLKNNLSEQGWPTHSSDELGISAQYPTNWYKNEFSRSIVFSSYPTTDTPPETFAQITITKQNNLKNIGISAWFDTTDRKKSDYLIDGSTLDISGQPAVKYIKKSNDKELLWLLYVSKDKMVYEITATAKNGQKTSSEEIFNKIIKTIKFLK